MTAPDVNADVRARFEEPLDVRRKVLVDSLRASKGWMTGYAEAFVDTYVDDAHADLAGEVRELVEAARYAMNNIHMVDGTAMDAVVGPTFTMYGMFLNKLHAALAKFKEKP